MLTPSNGIFPRQKCAKNCLNSGEIEDGIREPTVSEPLLCEKKKLLNVFVVCRKQWSILSYNDISCISIVKRLNLRMNLQ